MNVAQLIPTKQRKMLLGDNVIYKAIVAANDTHMAILVIIYENYILTDGVPVDIANPCLRCLDNILKIFKNIEPDLIELERESNLLKSI